MKLSFTRENGELLNFHERIAQPPTDPTAGMVRYRSKSDPESPQWSMRVRGVAPAPAVNPVSGSKNTWPDTTRSLFTEAWQWFWVDCMSLQKYGKVFQDLPNRGSASKNKERNLIVTAFKDATAGNKFMTDSNGTDKHNNYITGEMRGSDPKQQSKITVSKFEGGAWLNSLYSRWPVEKNDRGVEMVRVDSFIAENGPPKKSERTVDILRDHRMHTALIIDDDGRLFNFPHLKGVALIYPFVTVGPAWYPRRELVAIP